MLEGTSKLVERGGDAWVKQGRETRHEGGVKTLFRWESRVPRWRKFECRRGSWWIDFVHGMGRIFDRSTDRSIRSFGKQGGRIYCSSFWDETRRFDWMVVRRGRERDDCLISRKILTRDRLTESQESCIHFHIQKRVQFRVIKRMKIKLQIEIWNSRIRAACFILILMKRGE